jgi:hypothetical protein
MGVGFRVTEEVEIQMAEKIKYGKPEIQILPQLSDMIRRALEAEKDCAKFDRGSLKAGKRVRKVMQDVRKQAKNIRVTVQIERNLRKDVKKAKANELQKSS